MRSISRYRVYHGTDNLKTRKNDSIQRTYYCGYPRVGRDPQETRLGFLQGCQSGVKNVKNNLNFKI